MRLGRSRMRTLAAGLAAAALFAFTHDSVTHATPLRPPSRGAGTAAPANGGIVHLGRAYARTWGGIREVYLEGTPEEIGTEQAEINYPLMVDNERAIWDDFSRYVPFWPARELILGLGKLKYGHIDQGFPDARRRELGAQSRAFEPDPFSDKMSTYQRMIFLHALYDIALGFEHSPLMGCSAFLLGPGATKDGHTLLARTFDFEAPDTFDHDKAVFFVRSPGTIPFASVAWPGLVGVMSGMNEAGVAVVVNGGRAKDTRTTGMPVFLSLREVLEHARDTRDATSILVNQEIMVSHIVVIADAHGAFAVVERAPGAETYIRRGFPDRDRVGVTNHFEGPLSTDPKNVEVLKSTSTVARRQRLDELLASVGPHAADVPRAVAMLRDHACAGHVACELGDRRTIDAFIATHGVVADTTSRTLWVSAGPHLSGHFTRFDLRRIFAPGHVPEADTTAETLPDDPVLHDGRYELGRARAGGPRVGGDAAAAPGRDR